MKRGFHTTLDIENIKKLKEYGKGFINRGIEGLIKIADSKEITVTIITEVQVAQVI